MVSKEKFLDFIALVKKNEEAVSALENSLDSYSIRGLSILSLFNSAHIIAGDYLDMDEDYFYEDFGQCFMMENQKLKLLKIMNYILLL